MKRNYKAVLVSWLDSNILHGWQDNAKICKVAISEELGYLIHEDEEKITLARGISDGGLFNSPMAIPKGCIKSIKEMRVK